MSEVQSGLRLAAPRVNGKQVADLSIDELLGGMNAETKTAMAAALAAQTPPPKAANKDDGDAEDMVDGGADEDAETPPKEKSKKKGGAEASATFADGMKAGTDRALAVMAHESFAGREPQAQKLLGNQKLTAEEITGMLADMPDGGGQQMLDSIKGKNPDLGAGGGSGEGDRAQAAASIWDKAIVANNPGHKIG